MTTSTRSFICLINPKSGTAKKDIVLKELKKKLTEKKFAFEIVFTNAEGNYEFLKEKISAEKITDVVIIGGDGTVNQVVNSLRKTKVNFSIIPFGSGNGLAFAAKIPKNYLKAIELIFTETPKPVDAFLINDQFSCMLSGIGFDAAVAHAFAKQNKRGLVTYTKQTFTHFFKAKPYGFEIISDGISFNTEAFFISIANANQFGNNFTIAPKALLDDGLLDIVVVQKMSKAKLLFEIKNQIDGKNRLVNLNETLSKKNIIYFNTSSIIIKNFQLAPLHIDGEPKETSEEIKVEILKSCFKLIHS